MRILANMVNKFANSKIGKSISNPVTAGAAAAWIATISCVTKDGVNCAYYVHQSLNNERIPEEKRKFVASLDLANGILNVITQLAIGPATEWLTNKGFEKFITPKYFSTQAAKAIQEMDGIKGKVPLEAILDKLSKDKRIAKIGLGVISSLVGTQIIAKRIVVPFIATPMASFFKERMEKGAKKQTAKNEVDSVSFKNNTENTQKPPEAKKLPECFKQFR